MVKLKCKYKLITGNVDKVGDWLLEGQGSALSLRSYSVVSYYLASFFLPKITTVSFHQVMFSAALVMLAKCIPGPFPLFSCGCHFHFLFCVLLNCHCQARRSWGVTKPSFCFLTIAGVCQLLLFQKLNGENPKRRAAYKITYDFSVYLGCKIRQDCAGLWEGPRLSYRSDKQFETTVAEPATTAGEGKSWL